MSDGSGPIARSANASLGGGSGAIAASAHAACARFRGTDPLIVRRTRRRLAADIGFPDNSGRIPSARWMRAMTFERLVHDEAFASQVTTMAVGRLSLARPTQVGTVRARESENRTVELLAMAHDRAVSDGDATLIQALAVPFPGFERLAATSVKPDFAIVAPRVDQPGSWVIVGDSKDYERMRSKIDDMRLLKGFLQVAVGAESLATWSRLPEGMTVHQHGVLAVPRNAFLQPEPLVELLDDHRREVRQRIAERLREAELLSFEESTDPREFVACLTPTFQPTTCTTCPLFSYCRHELRTSSNPGDLLVEIGIAPNLRPNVAGLIDGSGVAGRPPESTVANVQATVTGVAQTTGQWRTDPVGLPGTINIVIAKSDAAALGVHGIALQRVTASGREDWATTVFSQPQSPNTRRQVMQLLGNAISAAMAEQYRANPGEPAPVHLVVPDSATADVLVSIADNMAGIELSRLRWEQDVLEGRPALTYNGEPAEIPPPLEELSRTAVSFLLEEDRARALTLRSPIVDIRAVLARHIHSGGPAVAAYRLDYLIGWAGTLNGDPLRPREFEDQIESCLHSPGARLTNRSSNAIHAAMTADPAAYHDLVAEELAYKCATVDAAVDYLKSAPESTLRRIYRALEGDAQEVWRRRLLLHASDLIRFGRTYRRWRNALVETIEGDATCRSQLLALTNPQSAADLAVDAGMRFVATATVVDAETLTLTVDSRRVVAGSRIVLLHRNGTPQVETAGITVQSLKSCFKIDGLSIGALTALPDSDNLVWMPEREPAIAVGDRLVVADIAWFADSPSDRFLKVDRPKPDSYSAPKSDCLAGSYRDDPDSHRFCCRPHEISEAEWSDELAARRARGELNPEAWPPVVDIDAFEVSRTGAPTGESLADGVEPVPEELTLDDVD